MIEFQRMWKMAEEEMRWEEGERGKLMENYGRLLLKS